MTATATIPVHWSDIQTMPRGEARDRLEHAYRQQQASLEYARTRATTTAGKIRHDAETHRIRALDTYRDTPEDQAARLNTINRDANHRTHTA